MSTDYLALACVVGLCCATPAFAKPDPEPPSPEFDSGPHTSSLMFVLNPDRDCRELNGDPGPTVRVRGCYVRMIDQMLVPSSCDPSRGTLGRSCSALIRHEEGHARGGIHGPNGQWMPASYAAPKDGQY